MLVSSTYSIRKGVGKRGTPGELYEDRIKKNLNKIPGSEIKSPLKTATGKSGLSRSKHLHRRTLGKKKISQYSKDGSRRRKTLAKALRLSLFVDSST